MKPRASQLARVVKNPRVRSLGWEEPLEEGTAAHSSVLAWRIPWTEEPGGLQSTGSQRDTTEVTERTGLQPHFILMNNIYIYSWTTLSNSAWLAESMGSLPSYARCCHH